MNHHDRIALNERMARQAIAAGNAQHRCGGCGRVRAEHEFAWRLDIYGEPLSPLCVDARECVRFTQWLCDHACGGIPNMADPTDYAPN